MEKKPHLTAKVFMDLLIRYKIVDEGAIYSAEDYDDFETFDNCIELLAVIREHSVN